MFVFSDYYEDTKLPSSGYLIDNDIGVDIIY